MPIKEHPVVFVSYARTTKEHIKWVVDFTNKLRDDSIDAKVDEFKLKLGHDLNYFMEKYIKEDADFVLLMCTKEYVQKANKRIGGVGTEAQILSSEVYNDVTQEKIIPIILEFDENGNPYLPTFVKTRYSIDLSSDEKFHENYEKLLRTIFNEPEFHESELGEKPHWLSNPEVQYPKTKSLINKFDKQIENNPSIFNLIINDFFEEYSEYLKTFKIKYSSNNSETMEKELYDNLAQYEQLKNDLELFLEKIFKVGSYQQINSESIIKFLSNIYSLIIENYHASANFDFILRETFLYFIAYGLKYENYEVISDLFYSPYYLEDYSPNSIQHFINLDFRGLIYTDKLLGEYFLQNNEPTINPIGELLIRRLPKNLDEELLVDADLLSCYVSYLNYDNFDNEEWFPFTLMYKHRSKPFNLFRKLTSERFFKKVKIVFDVDTEEEFKKKVISTRILPLGKGEVSFRNPLCGKVKPIEDYIDLEKICTER